MIIVRLMGGLGNQMFQYALGRCLAEKHRTRLLLDTSKLSGRMRATPRDYSLKIFNVKAEITNMADVAKASALVLSVVQCQWGFHREIFDIVPQPDLVLEGYWQSERYFRDIEQLIRSEFTFRSPQTYDHEDATLPAQMAATKSVCLHVRRTDYLKPENAFLGFVGLDYYQRAIEFMMAKLTNPHFYVFSDDMEWCIENLSFSTPHTFVQHKRPVEDGAEQDLRLMTTCKHFIIANSSFSWWAAWLATTQDKIVLAPKQWLSDGTQEARDVIPSGWFRI